MSSSFSANQYEGAYKSQKLQNWTLPKHFKEKPCSTEGHTSFIATDRGHLLPGMKAKSGSAWTSFVGTWDLPNRIPPTYVNPTARSHEGQERLRNWSNHKGTKKATTTSCQEAEAQSAVRASKTQEEVTTDLPVNQDPPVEATDFQRTPELDRPASQLSQAPLQKSPNSERPASQKNANSGRPASNERPATQHGSDSPKELSEAPAEQ